MLVDCAERNMHDLMLAEVPDPPSELDPEYAGRSSRQIIQVGIDTRSAPLEVVGQCAAALDEIAQTRVRSALWTAGVEELVFLSTCQRVEWYAASSTPDRVASTLSALLGELVGDLDCVPVRVRHGRDAVAHLIAVAAGLESALAGEHEILGQVRRAYQVSRALGSTGPMLERLFQHAIESARKVRQALRIDREKQSLTGIAAAWLRQHCSEASDLHVAVVGSGVTARQMLDHLKNMQVRRIMIIGRQPDRVHLLALRHGCTWEALNRLPELLSDLDVIIYATASSKVLLPAEIVRQALTRREHPLFIVDLGMPRNVDPDVEAVPGVRFLEISTLFDTAQKLSMPREESSRQVRRLLQSATDEYVLWQQVRHLGPLLQSVRTRYVETVRSELARTWTANATTECEDRHHIATRLANRLLHPLFLAVKSCAGHVPVDRMESFLKILMGETDDTPPAMGHSRPRSSSLLGVGARSDDPSDETGASASSSSAGRR